jgi:predicted amidohydrolase YtcJ
MWSNISALDSLFNNGLYKEKPVLLLGTDGHTAWCNSVLLKQAGVTKQFISSLAPSDKQYYGVNDNDEPTGFVSEDAIKKVDEALPPGSVTTYNATMSGVKHLNSLGITAWLDPSAGNISDGLKNEKLLAYEEVSRNQLLTAHVATTVVANPNSDVKFQISTLKNLQEKFKNTKNLTVLGFKVFADGVLEYPTQTASISISYSNSGKKGSLMFDLETFKTFVTIADRESMLVHIHAIGDLAVTESLNAFAVARETNGNDNIPHSITHLQLVRPTDFKRFASLNILPCMQMFWATADSYSIDLVKPYIDSTLFKFQYPANSLVKAGAILCGASDWPVTTANPFEAIAMAETRKGSLGILNENEIVSRTEMIKAYTIHAARALMMDKKIGSIEPGKQADFVLVDRDVFNVGAESINDTQVVWTIFGGEIVFKQR